MIELPDDELDKLFRKSAEEFDPTFDPQDWNALRKKLDEEDGQRPALFWLRKWWPLMLAGLLFLGGTGLYFGLKKTETPLSEVKATSELKEGVAINEAGADDTAPVTTEKPALDEDNNITETKSTKIKPRSESKASGVFLESNYSKKQSGAGAILSKKKISSQKTDYQIKSKTDRNEESGLVDDNQKSISSTIAPIGDGRQSITGFANTQSTDMAVTQQLERQILKVDMLESRPFSYANKLSIGGPSVPKSATDAKAEKSEPAERPTYPKFAVRFGVSPDFSSVEFMKGARVGNAVSLFGEYAIVRRLYIQAGVIRSLKKYAANQGEYEWPGNWTQPVLPESVDAVCKIIELPLNLRFDIASNERSRWSVTAGASSYQMRDEKYDYNYKKHVPGIKWYSWQGETGWYWFSHLNASVGYEYRVSKSLSLMAEPYVTVPIKKVGFGQVNLFTTGIWISIRYSPFHK